MKLTQRPGQGGGKSVRMWLSRRAAAAVTAATLACFALGSSAMTRTVHPHPRSAEQEPVPSHHHSSSHSTASHGNSHSSSSHAKAVPVSSKSHHTQAKPIVASHSSHHTTHETASRTSSREVHAHHSSASPDKVEAKSRTAPLPAHRGTRLIETVEVKRPEVKHPAAKAALTSNDFLRAAGVAKDADTAKNTDTTKAVYAEGVSHPTEMDEEQPSSAAAKVVAQKLPPAQVSANNLAATKPKPATQRVEGFGSEVAVKAAPTHRTLEKTMAQHREDVVATKPELPSADEQAEITEEAIKPVVIPALYSHGGRLIMPAPLKGTHEILVHQNEMADKEGLERIKNDTVLNQLRASHQLVRLPETASLDVNDDLPIERRYARPWTVHFAVDMAKAYESRFGDALHVNSAVRTVSYQLRLQRVNGNAASVAGETASPHLTGQAIDIGKHGMTSAEIAWMRDYLLPLMQAGKIDVEEEFQQACFHISVYRSYTEPAPKRTVKTEVASAARLRRVSQASNEDDDSSDQ